MTKKYSASTEYENLENKTETRTVNTAIDTVAHMNAEFDLYRSSQGGRSWLCRSVTLKPASHDGDDDVGLAAAMAKLPCGNDFLEHPCYEKDRRKKHGESCRARYGGGNE